MPTGVYIRTEEYRNKMSQISKGRLHTEESKKKISIAKIGKKLSSQHKEKLGIASRNRIRKPCSEETKQKLRIILTGKKRSEEIIKKMCAAQKGKHIGKKHSEETKLKISLANKNPSAETLDRMRAASAERLAKYTPSMLGKKASIETRLKQSKAQLGEKSYNWKGGLTPINNKIRQSIEYKLWREAVFKRDNWTCIWCGLRGHLGLGRRVILQADHIKSFAHHPELRFDVDNGRTLCDDCHKKTKSYGGNGNKKDIVLPFISFLIPQLNRYTGLLMCVESINNLNYPKELIETIILEGDESVPIKIKKGVEQSKGTWIVFAANDMTFHPDCISNALKCDKLLVSFNEGTLLPDMGNRCTHFMIKRDLIPLIGGEIFCTRMNHCGVDNLLWAKCEKLGEAHYCVDAKITHNHFSKGGQWDEVYEKGWSKVEEDRKILQEELALL